MAVASVLSYSALGRKNLESVEVGNCPGDFRSLKDLVGDASFGSSAKHHFGFRDNPCSGNLAGLSFMAKKSRTVIRQLVWPDPEKVTGDIYSAQQAKIGSLARTVSCVEIAQFARQYFLEKGCYPDLGWTWLLSNDLVVPNEWPNWYIRFRQADSILRVAIRFDPSCGVIVSLVAADSLVANGVIALTW
ncbi:MAG: hypothetical protein WCX71_01235 [Candidatus Buchananbacteria bacterium]